MLISRLDFVGRINIGANVPDADIEISINNAQLYVFKPLVDPLLYSALTALTSGSSPSELKSFWADYVKPFLVFAFVKDFVVLHGRNFVQFGITEMLDDTSKSIDNDSRTELIALFERNYNIELSRLKARLNEVSFTFDGTKYLEGDLISTIKPRSMIRPIG